MYDVNNSDLKDTDVASLKESERQAIDEG